MASALARLWMKHTVSRLHRFCALTSSSRCYIQQMPQIQELAKIYMGNTLSVKQIEVGSLHIGDRNIHCSRVLMKKFKESLYEKVRIFDPSGDFLCSVEMLVLEKFCQRYSRFLFEEMKEQGTASDDNLRAYQLKDKHPQETTKEDKTEKKIKTVKFGNDTSADKKLAKIVELLVNDGAVAVTFRRKRDMQPEIKTVLKDYCDIKTMISEEKFAKWQCTLRETNSKLLKNLLEDIHQKEKHHIDSVHDWLDLVKKKDTQ